MRLIDAEELSAQIMKRLDICEKEGYREIEIVLYNIVVPMVVNAPTIDAVEVRHGKWIVTAGGKECDCPVCGEWFDNTCNYDIGKTWEWCPVCGARMDGDKHD